SNPENDGEQPEERRTLNARLATTRRRGVVDSISSLTTTRNTFGRTKRHIVSRFCLSDAASLTGKAKARLRTVATREKPMIYALWSNISRERTGLLTWFLDIVKLNAGGDVVLLYASKYHDIKNAVNISARYDLKRGIDASLGKDFVERIKKEGSLSINLKNRPGKAVKFPVTGK
ncbi:hypothetical protein LINGRAHAP2_LOCUS33706, partial [Linum grandiflorum]